MRGDELLLAALKPGFNIFQMAVSEGGDFGIFMVNPILDPSKEGDFIGQHIDADQDAEESLSGNEEHNDSGQNKKPSGQMLEYPLCMPVPDQPFHGIAIG